MSFGIFGQPCFQGHYQLINLINNFVFYFTVSLGHWQPNLAAGKSLRNKESRAPAWTERPGKKAFLQTSFLSAHVSKTLKTVRATASKHMNVPLKLGFTNQQRHLGNLLKMQLLDLILYRLSQKFWGWEKGSNTQSVCKLQRFW